MLDNFNAGYTKALTDLKRFFENEGYSWDRKSLKTLIDVCIDHRAELRENGSIDKLKYGKQKGFYV